MRGQLTEKQINAILILYGHREMPLHEKATTSKAINRTTAWGLVDHELAETWYKVPKGEVVRLRPHTRQLITLGRRTAVR